MVIEWSQLQNFLDKKSFTIINILSQCENCDNITNNLILGYKGYDAWLEPSMIMSGILSCPFN